ncbi:hypothetical protein AB6A40_006457 [Gnathostoma spinigerum]|uniref:Serpin domain-containing protein n=1 Tax=Gnathostoma spinigerum TaxID=75299 RepID=A0ABD6EIF3_9BILA
MIELQADFALDLFRRCCAGSRFGRSSVISPIIVSAGLAMTFAGANGRTKKEILEVLGGGGSCPRIIEFYGHQLGEMLTIIEGSQFRVANRLYIPANVIMNPTFNEIINNDFHGRAAQLNFEEPIQAAKEINDYVSECTNHNINDLIKASDINRNDPNAMMIISGIYYNGPWEFPFEIERTTRAPFYESKHRQREVDMMTVKGEFPYTQSKDLQVLGIPFKRYAVYLFVFLPLHRFGYIPVEDQLSGSRLLSLMDSCDSSEVEVKLPRFAIERELDMIAQLEQMGVHEAFTHDADFSNITDQKRLYISKFYHKASIRVDERGSQINETKAEDTPNSHDQGHRPGPAYFIADHPFLFAVVKYDVIVFIGSVQ